MSGLDWPAFAPTLIKNVETGEFFGPNFTTVLRPEQARILIGGEPGYFKAYLNGGYDHKVEKVVWVTVDAGKYFDTREAWNAAVNAAKAEKQDVPPARRPHVIQFANGTFRGEQNKIVDKVRNAQILPFYEADRRAEALRKVGGSAQAVPLANFAEMVRGVSA